MGCWRRVVDCWRRVVGYVNCSHDLHGLADAEQIVSAAQWRLAPPGEACLIAMLVKVETRPHV